MPTRSSRNSTPNWEKRDTWRSQAGSTGGALWKSSATAGRKGRIHNGGLQRREDRYLAGDLPLHLLDWGTETNTEAGIQDQAGRTGVGAGAAEQSYLQSGYDLLQFRGAVHSGYADPPQRKHLGHQRTHHSFQAAALLREAENVQYHRPADHYLAERDAELQGQERQAVLPRLSENCS